MELLIVTGLSGAGKSKAMDYVEDLGYYCIDNVPADLLSTFIELCKSSATKLSKVAFGIDIRSDLAFENTIKVLTSLKQSNLKCRILFMDAPDNVLINRYKETRRKHPLLSTECNMLQDAIKKERVLVEPIKNIADSIINTGDFTLIDLKEQISSLFSFDNKSKFNVVCISYGTKYGASSYADLVFDVRCFPNPYYVTELKSKTGLDKPVFDYVFQDKDAISFKNKLFDMLDLLLPLYEKEGKVSVVIAFACTGGKHRSVAFAEATCQYLSIKGFNVSVNHRDIDKL